MSVVHVVVREDVIENVTTVERVFADGLLSSGYRKALQYVRDQDNPPGVEFHIEEMPVY